MYWLSQTAAVTERDPALDSRSGSGRRSSPSSASPASSSSSRRSCRSRKGSAPRCRAPAIRRPSSSSAPRSDTEMTSGFGGEEARLISEGPGLERGPEGDHASPELFVIVGHPLKRSGTDANVPLRGVTLVALKVRPTGPHRRGPDVHSRARTRSSWATRRRRQFSGLTVGSRPAVGRQLLAGRRDLRRGRQRIRVRDVVRREGAAARLSARQQLSVGHTRGWRRPTPFRRSRTR